MVTPGWGVEMRDPEFTLTDRTGGIYLCTKQELIPAGVVTVIAVRRPPHLDIQSFQDATLAHLGRNLTFASAALALMPPLRAVSETADWLRLRSWPRMLQSIILAVTRRLELHERRLVYAIADGPETMVCTELVYRALAAGGCLIDLSASGYFDAALAHVPPAKFEPVEARFNIVAFEEAVATRKLAPDFATPSSKDYGRLLNPGVSNLRRRLLDRRVVVARGDHADLVAPSDLFFLPPLETVAVMHRVKGKWISRSDRPESE